MQSHYTISTIMPPVAYAPGSAQYPCEESNLTLDLRTVACLRDTPRINSTPARSRTWTCSFGGSHDVRFTTRANE